MRKKKINNKTFTNDVIIRSALKEELMNRHSRDKKVVIVNEFGVEHGMARIDIAVINGIMHGYEIKSDQDNLQRLPEQINAFNSVFDKITLVVGKSHLHQVIRMVPEWWGITIAKIDNNGNVVFNLIRNGEYNKGQNDISVARLLWREEALKILEKNDESKGFYSKPRELIYEKLTGTLNSKTLNKEVRETIFLRKDWRSDALLTPNGG